jgi:hypothetical protein
MLGQTQRPRGEQPWSYGTDARKLLFFCARNDVVRYTTKELLDIAAQCTTNEEVVGSLLVLGGREVAPNNSRATPYNIAVQGAKKDAKDGKKRWKQCPQWVAIMTGYDDDDDDMKADDSDKEYITTIRRGIMQQGRPPTNHFEKLLEEAYPYHAYPVKHKCKDRDMIKNFMISGFLAWDKELKGDLGGKGVTPFTGDEAVMMVYGGPPPPERCCISNLSPRTLTHCG